MEIIKGCNTCIRKDKSDWKSGKYVETERPGELVSFDMLEIEKNKRIIIGIDYFTRKLYDKYFTSKETDKILKFIKQVYEEFLFEAI